MIDTEVFEGRPFVMASLTLDFIGGVKDGTSEDLPSWFLEARVSGQRYHLALARSDDPSVPFKYVLVHESLVEKP